MQIITGVRTASGQEQLQPCGQLACGPLAPHAHNSKIVQDCARSNEMLIFGREIHNALARRNKRPPIRRLATHTAVSGAEHEVCVSTQGLSDAFVFQWRLISKYRICNI